MASKPDTAVAAQPPDMADRTETLHDPVEHPRHYTQGGIEAIEAIEAALGPTGFRAYCKGNALKYLWRESHKGGNESLRKARWYLDRAIQGGTRRRRR